MLGTVLQGLGDDMRGSWWSEGCSSWECIWMLLGEGAKIFVTFALGE